MGLAQRTSSRRRSSGCRARAASATMRQLLRELARHRCRAPERARAPWPGAARSRSTTACATGAPIVHDRHDGPLRVLRALHPEGGGLPQRARASARRHRRRRHAGDRDRRSSAGAHALVTTPGATRFYRSAGATATQTLAVARRRRRAGSSGCRSRRSPTAAASRATALRFELAPGAEMIGWDVTALGLPASDQPVRRRPLHPVASSCPAAGSSAARSRAERPRAARLAARLGRPARPGDAVVRQPARRSRRRAARPCSTPRARRLRRPSARRHDRRDRRRSQA